MSEEEIERKIAVIFATDVVGYSDAMELDEIQTLKNLKMSRKILDDLFSKHGGRVFNTAGDSVLAEFSSAVSAVVCAVEFQKLIKERNDTIAFQQHIIEQLTNQLQTYRQQNEQLVECKQTYEELLQKNRFHLKQLSIDLRDKDEHIQKYKQVIQSAIDSRQT